MGWKKSWTALFLASILGYILADLFFMSLYIPNRYTRYSMAVILVLWHAHNWDLLFRAVPWKSVQMVLLVTLLVCGGILFRDTFEQGKEAFPRIKHARLSRFIRSLPEKVLVAGHPRYMDDIPIQARRSVLSNYKMAHPWYSTYYQEIKRRTEATFRALYAVDKAAVNALANDYDVTHLVVAKKHYQRSRIQKNRIYVNPFNDFIRDLTQDRPRFLLETPPAEAIVYEDPSLWVITLPLT